MPPNRRDDVSRRGKLRDLRPTVKVGLDSLLTAALASHTTNTDNPHAVTVAQIGAAAAFWPLAAIYAEVGVTRAILLDAWRYEPMALGDVLSRASLRG